MRSSVATFLLFIISISRTVLSVCPALSKRDGDNLSSEFIGYTGTNSGLAEGYMKLGRAGKGLPVLKAGFNGGDAELGAGMYVTDSLDVAIHFSGGSAGGRNNKAGPNDPKVTRQICMVEAMVSDVWRDHIPKVWIPQTMFVRSAAEKAAKVQQQSTFITHQAHIADHIDNVIKFGRLSMDNNDAGTGNQVVIPTNQFDKVYIRCCTETAPTKSDDLADKSPAEKTHLVNEREAAERARILAYFKQHTFPMFSFRDPHILAEWKIHHPQGQV